MDALPSIEPTRPRTGGTGRPWRRRLIAAGCAVLALALLWAGGLAWFTGVIPDSIADPDTTTDAIVVLTGGSGRLKEGIALLAQGKAKKLFVSGVYHGVDVTELLRLARVAPKPLECCIALGHTADSTYGNAVETRQWMTREHFTSLRLVTSAYHMPRSLYEFRRAMPGIEIVPNPVFPEAVKRHWWRWPGSSNLVIGEYDKYLAAILRGGAENLVAAGP